eukprot:TRINITY_DN2740_c0_g2_i6.p1 TRINITY_DN2740_c0_g2~~TRINITY_DN2740_c0_g2_i6.p1  ORF type:complete len:362 (+),score=28.34 TRINITY_DN2740_c0_g2_i6:126-1211(+)
MIPIQQKGFTAQGKNPQLRKYSPVMIHDGSSKLQFTTQDKIYLLHRDHIGYMVCCKSDSAILTPVDIDALVGADYQLLIEMFMSYYRSAENAVVLQDNQQEHQQPIANKKRKVKTAKNTQNKRQKLQATITEIEAPVIDKFQELIKSTENPDQLIMEYVMKEVPHGDFHESDYQSIVEQMSNTNNIEDLATFIDSLDLTIRTFQIENDKMYSNILYMSCKTLAYEVQCYMYLAISMNNSRLHCVPGITDNNRHHRFLKNILDLSKLVAGNNKLYLYSATYKQYFDVGLLDAIQKKLEGTFFFFYLLLTWLIFLYKLLETLPHRTISKHQKDTIREIFYSSNMEEHQRKTLMAEYLVMLLLL